MQKKCFQGFLTSLVITVLSPPISFSAYMHEPFCLIPLPLLSTDAFTGIIKNKHVGKLICLVFQAGENQLCTVYTESKTIMQLLLQVCQHLHQASVGSSQYHHPDTTALCSQKLQIHFPRRQEHLNLSWWELLQGVLLHAPKQWQRWLSAGCII